MNKLVLTVLLIANCLYNYGQVGADRFDYKNREYNHDVTVPSWGPYTKKYMGISHIADSASGLRFDLSVMSGFYRQKVMVPNVLYQSGYYPWNASADLNYFSFRQELEWKDKVFTDVSFAPLNAHARLVQMTCTNNTEDYQNMVLHLVGSLQYPEINPVRVVLPSGSKWQSAIDYESMHFARPRPQDNLTYDGWIKGEVRNPLFVGGSGLGRGFGKNAGDQVRYSFEVQRDMEQALVLIRYKAPKAKNSDFIVNGLYNKPVSFTGTGEMEELKLNVGRVIKGRYNLTLQALGSGEIELDGFTIIDENEQMEVQYKTDFHPVPEIMYPDNGKSLILHYKDVPQYYGISWMFDASEVREFYNDQLDIALPLSVNNHADKRFSGNEKGHFTDVFLRPIPLSPRQTKVIYALVCSGKKEEVEQQLRAFHQQRDYSSYFEKYLIPSSSLSFNPEGAQYQFSQQIIRANTLQNVVFPVYTGRSYIKHFTPGRWWNSLYTWDNGFIGLGMTEIDTLKAIELLNAYTSGKKDSNAFVHHGSLVPVQFFLYHELWNRTRSKQLLTYFYPRLKKYYLFYTGRSGSSTMRIPEFNLIRPWDYFYNSGGWDDYPPQKQVHKNGLASQVTPVINTAMAIRIAKILNRAATMLDYKKDLKIYTEDINSFSRALQDHSWDSASGYFSYVVHDKNGRPEGIFRTESGVNQNMGMDGAYPLVAGVCTLEQQKRLLSHLFSDKGCWTPVGLSAVDQSAPYYSNEGYWNGTVWFPHQWFFWKSLFDLGEGDKAAQVAFTALEVWKKEAGLTYHSAEHFSIETGRGAGWHQFSGLSTPVMLWFGAYFRPGTLTTGFDAWLESCQFSSDNTSLKAVINFTKSTNNPTVLVCLKSGKKYEVLINNHKASYKEVVGGALQISIPKNTKDRVELDISRE